MTTEQDTIVVTTTFTQDGLTPIESASHPQIKSYTYTKTSKDGKTKEITVKRKYVNKLDRSNSLQNKENKDLVINNIIQNKDRINELNSRKRVKFVKEFCIPPNVTASYNTIRALLEKYLNDKTEEPIVEETFSN